MTTRRTFIGKTSLLGISGVVTGGLGFTNAIANNINKNEALKNEESIRSLVDKLFDAIKTGNKSQVEKLLNKEPGLRFIQDHKGRSLLWIAALNNHKELFSVIKNPEYVTDIFDMVAIADTEAINNLVKKDASILNITNKSGYTPLLAAAECGQGASSETLIGIGAWIDAQLPVTKAAPIHLALQYPLIAEVNWMVQVILGNGGNPNITDEKGNTPLHFAVANNNEFAVKMLLRKKADTSNKNKEGKTAENFFSASTPDKIKQLFNQNTDAKKDLYITRFNTKAGTVITRDDTYGLPYILVNEFVTSAHFNIEKTKKLLKQIPDLLLARATWDEIGVEGCTHLGNEPLCNFLLDAGSPLSICGLTMLGFEEQVKDLIKSNPLTINDRGPHDFPLIWYTAIGKPKPGIAEFLIANGADVNANIRGRSVLSECARRGHAELTELLIQNGADVNMVSISSFMGGTPLQIAKAWKSDNVITVLKKYGAKE